MADEEEEFFLPMYVEEEEEAVAAAEKARRREESSLPMRKKAEEKAARWKKLEKQSKEDAAWWAIQQAHVAKITEFDPKKGAPATFRFTFCDLSIFDLDAESTVGPSRHSARPGPLLVTSANFLSVLVTASNVGYPVNVFGTIRVFDDLHHQFLDIFHRDRNNSQPINSPDKTLCLIGPSRGLVVLGRLYVEIDLKIRGDQEDSDMVFCEGVINDISVLSYVKTIRNVFPRALGTVQLSYVPAKRAVEAIIKIIFIERGLYPRDKKRQLSEFHGQVVACTAKVPSDGASYHGKPPGLVTDDIILYDSEVPGTVIQVGDDGLIQLSRCVIVVPINQTLLLDIYYRDSYCSPKLHKSERTASFAPKFWGRGTCVLPFGSHGMQVEVDWSALYCSGV